MCWRRVGVLGGKQTPETAQQLLIYNLRMSHLHLPPSAICLGPEEESGSLWIREPKQQKMVQPSPRGTCGQVCKGGAGVRDFPGEPG